MHNFISVVLLGTRNRTHNKPGIDLLSLSEVGLIYGHDVV